MMTALLSIWNVKEAMQIQAAGNTPRQMEKFILPSWYPVWAQNMPTGSLSMSLLQHPAGNIAY
jgi:hypothetical protein